MTDLISKIKVILKRLKVVVVVGKRKKEVFKLLQYVLGRQLKIGRDVLLFEAEDKEIEKFDIFLKKSQTPVLVITDTGEGGSKEIKETRNFIKRLPSQIRLVLNHDDQVVRELDELTNFQTFKFGFNDKAEISATDINLNNGNDNNEKTTNFKVNYKGKSVPIWLKNISGKEKIYPFLAAISAGTVLGLNLVEISEALREYQPKDN